MASISIMPRFIPIGEWWKTDNVMEIPGNANITGGEPIRSDAYTINGEPGYLYPCSTQGMDRYISTPKYIKLMSNHKIF